VTAAISWIGSSFYFIALDLGLRKTPSLPKLAHGEEWQVHGGGFYHITKYLVAPEFLPEHLTWFKWESYFTWFSGFALLAVLYYAGANIYLVDPHVLNVPAWGGVLISLTTIVVGWLVYDALCKSPIGKSTSGLMVALFVVLVIASFVFYRLFSARAAMLHMGIFTATIMVANVAVIIIPNQNIVVGDLKAGRTPDAKYGYIAKQRSLHNNYLTLPVIFFMLSTHYPLAFATRYSWVIAALVFLEGVVIRHFFNTRHAGKGSPNWTWLAAVVIFIVIAWLSQAPKLWADQDPNTTQVSSSLERYVAAPQFAEVKQIIGTRCTECHSAVPGFERIMEPPKDVRFDSDALIAEHAKDIAMEAGFSRAMPPANVSEITDRERAMIVDWYRQANAGRGVLSVIQ
jgi:uncharacterized membrane protein